MPATRVTTVQQRQELGLFNSLDVKRPRHRALVSLPFSASATELHLHQRNRRPLRAGDWG